MAHPIQGIGKPLLAVIPEFRIHAKHVRPNAGCRLLLRLKGSQNLIELCGMPSRMTGTTEPAWHFDDAEDHVQIDLPDLSAGVKASFTGDSVQIRRTDGSGEVLFEVPQLYSTIAAEGSRLEVWSSSSFPVVMWVLHW